MVQKFKAAEAEKQGRPGGTRPGDVTGLADVREETHLLRIPRESSEGAATCTSSHRVREGQDRRGGQ